jgi:lipase ATG15
MDVAWRNNLQAYEPEEEEVVFVGGDQETEIKHKHAESPSTRTVDRYGHVHYKDHFTLKNPSGTVRYRGSNVRVLEQRNAQILLEQYYTTEEEEQTTFVVVKHVSNERAFGLNFLRFVYILFCLLFSGMLFIFSFLLLLFLFMDLVPSVDDGDDTQSGILTFLGALFAIPMFIYSLASAMAIAGTFITDTWSGHVFLRTIADVSLIFTEWAAFMIFIGIPVIVGTITLLMGLDDWWQIMTLVWFGCIGVYYVLFAAAVVYYEVHATFHFMRELDSNTSSEGGWQGLLRRAILIRMTFQLSGIKKRDRLTNVGILKETTPRAAHDNEFSNYLKTCLYSRMTLTQRCFFGRFFFDKVDPPERLYSLEEILGTRQFVTRSNWSLEKIFCARNRTRMVTVVRGPFALLPSTRKSSLACAIVGGFLVIFFFIAMTTWASTAIAPLTLLVIAIVCCFIPLTRNSIRIFRTYKDVLEAQVP